MFYRLNIFSKILILLVLLLTPIVLLYSFTNRTTNQVIQDQIQSSNLNQLSFFLHQLDANIENLSMFPVILAMDPYIKEYIDKVGSPTFDALKAQSRIAEKLSLQSVSSGWSNELTIAMPAAKRIVSSSIFVTGTDASWNGSIRNIWTYDQPSGSGAGRGGGSGGSFVREVGEPFRAQQMNQAAAVFQVRFVSQNIVNLLDVYKQDRKSDPFLYAKGYAPILNGTSAASVVEPIRRLLGGQDLPKSGQQQLDIEGQRYLISFVRSEQLRDWYLVDYVPVQQILAPITKTRNLFYFSIGLLLLMSVLASFLLYRNVQIPIVRMIRGVQQLKRGDLSTRIEYHARNEFDYLIQRFNEMAQRIQVLVEDVYAEKIRSREATLKQLQSQIHPHFLYNSLFFIINSAELEDKESVVAMAQNLAEFYRYTTRVENQTVRLRDELELVRHYLAIQKLRMNRLEFDIDVPAAMLDESVPRLILQPLVENAIVHGIERSMQGDRITITGEQGAGYNRLTVEDNGAGLNEEELHRLRDQIDAPISDEIGCGTWNVHHRLYYQFGEGSGLTFESGENGGVRAVLAWKRPSLPDIPAGKEKQP